MRSTASLTLRYSSKLTHSKSSGREAREDRGAAADEDAEALLAVGVDLRLEGDVVDVGQRAVVGVAAEGDLALTREQLGELVAHEVTHECAGPRRRVEDFAFEDAGVRVAGDVADGVAAALAAGEAADADVAQHLVHLGERNVVDLHCLARGDVRLLQRSVRLGDVAEGVHLVGGDAAERELDAGHVDAGLALAVDALLEAEADVLGLLDLAADEAVGFALEVVELLGDDRNDVARDVLEVLGVLDGAVLVSLGS